MENVLLIGVRGGIGKAIKKSLTLKYTLECFNSKILDLSNEESVNSFISNKKSKYNHVIFAAGINELVSFKRITHKIIKKTMDVNLLNFLVVLSSLLNKNLKNKNASVTMISSLYGLFGRKNRLPYVISKHAMNGACKTLAIELGKRGIRVNTISPGFINTDLTKKNLTSSEIKNIENKIPLKRLGMPSDIANMVRFLISKEAKYISGSDIVIDGGYSSGAFMGI